MAAFLFSIYHRLLLNIPATGLSFALPMTQEDLGDATGMSVVHANRTIRQLRQRNLVSIQDGVVTILDLQGLQKFSALPPIPKRDTTWI